MSGQAIIFIVCVVTIGFAYVGYPVLAGLMARLWGRPVRATAPAPRSASIVIAAYNEAGNIRQRVLELRGVLEDLDAESEIIVVSDGSTDDTTSAARSVANEQVRVIQLPSNMGKAIALNTGVAAARNPIVVFGDARQHWARDAVEKMIGNFADPEVGAVSGDLVLQEQDGSLAGVGLYWKLEKSLRRSESLIHSSVGVTGAICCVRRDLYIPLPEGLVLDDLCWPLAVVMQGKRVIHEPRAHAFDCLPESARSEMRRKVRTLSGNFQLVRCRPGILAPWRNPMWFGVICHKLLRLCVPWAMIAAVLACAMSDEPWLRVMLGVQCAGYAAGIVGLAWRRAGRLRLVNAMSSLLVLNTAALIAWLVYFSGRCGKSWRKVAYNSPLSRQSGQVAVS